ncbi:MAG TPA: hypothetical protein VLE02_01745 [Nitrosarchaeum sp.]|nr:hypothetical protein [Nitrosarchaeum sp.]
MGYYCFELGSDKSVGDIYTLNLTKFFEHYEDCERYIIRKYSCEVCTSVSKLEIIPKKKLHIFQYQYTATSIIENCEIGEEIAACISNALKITEILRLQITDTYNIYFAILESTIKLQQA